MARRNYVCTRGQFAAGELKWAILAILRQHQREVERGPCPTYLTARDLSRLTGGNYFSLQVLLLRWCHSRIVRREVTGLKTKNRKRVFGYSITLRGQTNFEILTNGYLRQQPGKRSRWVQVDAQAVLQRLPAYQKMREGG